MPQMMLIYALQIRSGESVIGVDELFYSSANDSDKEVKIIERQNLLDAWFI